MITVTLSNLNPDRPEEVLLSLNQPVSETAGRILQGRMDAFNDFGNAPLKAEPFTDFTQSGSGLCVRMPACSVAELRIRI